MSLPRQCYQLIWVILREQGLYLVQISLKCSMKKFTVRSLVLGLAGVVLMSFNNKEVKQTEPLGTSNVLMYGTNPESCEVIEFDALNEVESANGAITKVYSEKTPVLVSAQLRTAQGNWQNTNTAVLFNTSNPNGKYENFKTPSAAAARPMGNVLTAGKESASGITVYDKGSRVELDFSAMGSITLKGIHVLDITEDEAASTLEMLDASGKVIKTMRLPVTGAYGATRLNTQNTPGVVKLRITFESKNNQGGSGAIDVIEFCRS